MKYYGNEEAGGVNGHYYHVFNTVCSTSLPTMPFLLTLVKPLYYKIPDGAVL
jgi:hypothetical protein